MTKYLFLIGTMILALSINSCAQNEVRNVSPTEVKKKIDQGTDATLFDVRRPDEIEKGVINPDVLNYDFFSDDFQDNVAELDKEDTYYVYCHAGGRSAKTVKMMQEMGFKNVYNVDGGITKWQADGLNLVKKK